MEEGEGNVWRRGSEMCGGGGVKCVEEGEGNVWRRGSEISYLASNVTGVTFNVTDPAVVAFLLFSRDRDDLP